MQSCWIFFHHLLFLPRIWGRCYGAIKFNDMNQFGLAVEICGQVLNSLGAIFGLGLLPSRLGNFKSILIMAGYSIKIRSSRAAFLLKANPSTDLKKIDKNDLLEVLSAYYEFKIERLEAGIDQDEINIEDQVMILNEIELFRVKKAIEALTRRLSWYKSQPSETQAFPIFGALFIIILSLINSIANCVLCYFMWTYSASKRPIIAILICGAILVLTGISSAALVGFLNIKTKKKAIKTHGGIIPKQKEEDEDIVEKYKGDEGNSKKYIIMPKDERATNLVGSLRTGKH
ncbi:hypothetical protein BY996DRAFT_2086525 [Phakopsora pachyrhizi]|nr:hypothetical protein BY996DRAFT_2086525 [Phakopsora pachyrhizi]